MIQIFFEHKGIDLFIDGAHAISQIDINLTDLNISAYFSNFHKWSFVPKTAAFIFISDKYLKQIRPAITGNFKGQGIEREYFWTGTKDFTSYLCVMMGIQYYESFGRNQVRNYNRGLVLKAAKVMAEIWKTELFTEDTRLSSYMTNIRIPTDDA